MEARLIFLVGLSGSGKSTWAQHFVKENGAELLSSDSLRGELFGNEKDQNHNSEVFNELHKRAIGFLKRGFTVVYDATGLNASRRKSFLNQISNIECNKICVVFATPFSVCIDRDKLRNRSVGTKVIMKQLKQFQAPHMSEGWDHVLFLRERDSDYEVNLKDFIIENREVSHDCAPYHLESIREHMMMSAQLAEDNSESEEIIAALKFHDVGKFYTKGFVNTKGEPSEIAHYYSHENVSSYLFMTSFEWGLFSNSRYILYLIQYHMRPYFEGYDKFSKGLPEKLIQDLDKINKYDRLGRIIVQ